MKFGLFTIVPWHESRTQQQSLREAMEQIELADRLGLDELHHEILGISVPLVRIPVKPGRNIPTLVEVAARNQLLKTRGYRSAEAFQEEMLKHLVEPTGRPAIPAGRSEE